jgi:hypothetical protein
MKIRINKGKQFEGDKLFTIETKGDEAFSLYELLLLVNQLALNEKNKYRKAIKAGLPLFFEEAIMYCVLQGKIGIDLMENSNQSELIKICNKWKLKLEKFKQVKFNNFKNGI